MALPPADAGALGAVEYCSLFVAFVRPDLPNAHIMVNCVTYLPQYRTTIAERMVETLSGTATIFGISSRKYGTREESVRSAQERSAGNPHATICGRRRRVTASANPVDVEKEPRPNQ